MNTQKLIEIVCDAFELSTEQFALVSRRPYIVDARFAAMKLMREELKMKQVQIGREIRPHKKFDHTSIIHGIAEANNRIDTEPLYFKKYKKAVDTIRSELNTMVAVDFTSMRYRNT